MTNLPDVSTLKLEIDGGWLTVWLNRPEARNALSQEMVADMMAVIDAIKDDRTVRGVTFRGAGGVFCAGADLKAFQSAFDADVDPADIHALSQTAGRFFAAVDAMPQFTLMRVDGAAMAGGFGLACAGDMLIAAQDAKFALTETRIGITPAQIAPIVAARIGAARARRLMLTSQTLVGAPALEIGLVDALGADGAALDALEADVRARVMRCAPQAVADTKALIAAAGVLDREAMIELAAQTFANGLLGEEGREGISSFVEKRKPRWAEG